MVHESRAVCTMYAALEGRGGQLWSNNEVVLWLAGYERKGGKRRSPGNDMTAESQSLFFFFLRLLSVDRKFDLLLHRGGGRDGGGVYKFWRPVAHGALPQYRIWRENYYHFFSSPAI